MIIDGFYLGAGGTECPPGDLIPDIETCRVAHDALGISRSNEWTGTHGNIPVACGSRPTMSPNLHWNSADNGGPRSDVNPVCKGVCCGGPGKRIGGYRSRDLPPQHASTGGLRGLHNCWGGGEGWFRWYCLVHPGSSGVFVCVYVCVCVCVCVCVVCCDLQQPDNEGKLVRAAERLSLDLLVAPG